ncbi:MAG: hypothetical protein E7286_09460 [Lachnospiraceae bacterium]|nr:hypothetical protein [Lachnospiraceae bacterium]
MNEQIFRKKSIDRVSSPEQLDAYIRVANPGVWMVMIAIVLLLTGACVWGVLGHLDTTVSAAAVSENSAVIIYVKEAEAPFVREGMPVRIGDIDGTVTNIAAAPVVVDGTFSDYTLHVGNFQAGEWVYVLQTDVQLPQGVYNAQIVVESVAPLSFVVN